jgi:peptide/nickel transport system ATP-binding protein
MAEPNAAPAPLLAVDRLTVSTAAGTALVKEVSFTVDGGDHLGIIGESGSGKSLTATAIVGLLGRGLRSSGSIRLAGHQVVGASDRQLVPLRGRDAAIVFQDPSRALDPLSRVGAQVAEPLRRFQKLAGDGLRDAVIGALEEVALTDVERIVRSYPHQLSGGQRQRIAIALALACRPKLLIADEPTTALDVTVQAEVIDLLRELSDKRGMALVFISHDIGVISRVAESALVMQQGTVVERGPITQIISAPTDPYTRSLVHGVERLEAALSTGRLT